MTTWLGHEGGGGGGNEKGKERQKRTLEVGSTVREIAMATEERKSGGNELLESGDGRE